jgi:hypothetical protein
MFTGQSDRDFQQLTASLRFESDFDSARGLIQNHLLRVRELLSDFIAGARLMDPELKRAISKLSERGVSRILSSPYICEMMMVMRETSDSKAREQLSAQLLMALAAEIRIEDDSFSHRSNPLWSADGDVVLDDEIRNLFPALNTNCGIRLNYQSYAHNTGAPGIGGYSYSDALKHKERIETAKSIIAQVSTSALSMIDAFTTTIQLRQNKARPSIVNSSSHTSIGLIRCDNFHHLHRDMPELVDMLVHESIHQYLHLFEESQFEFIDTRSVPDGVLGVRDYASPWSGHLLDLRSYTHAILVWYGLSNFWGSYLKSGLQHPEISREAARKKLAESEVGFTNSNSVFDNLGDAKTYLDQAYESAVRSIHERLQNRKFEEGVA